MNIREGAIVSIEGSDTLWEVLEVDKNTCRLVDSGMGIIELEDVRLSEITGVVSEDEVA